jgi:MFS family permease
MKGSSYRFNYGWVIVGVTMVSMVLSDSGWQRGDTAAILSVNILVYGLAAPVAGHIADLWKPKNLMILGILLLALATAGHHWTPVQAMKTVRLWLFVLSESLFRGVGGYLVLAHHVGYSSLLAASIFALFGVAMLTGQFASLISDWIGREVTATLATVLVVIAIAALLLTTAAKAVWLLYAHAILFGLGVGGIVGPWLGGYLYDRMGSYTLPFLISGVCFLAACAGFWVAAPRRGVAPPRR